MKRRTPEERYQYSIRKQQKELEEFAAHEIEYADDLIYWYSCKKQDMPADEYRAAVFFKNREFQNKPGSLSLLYEAYRRCMAELPEGSRETAFDMLAFRFHFYSKTLLKGGYDHGG